MVVPDVDKACERFEELGVQFVKKPNDGMFSIYLSPGCSAINQWRI